MGAIKPIRGLKGLRRHQTVFATVTVCETTRRCRLRLLQEQDLRSRLRPIERERARGNRILNYCPYSSLSFPVILSSSSSGPGPIPRHVTVPGSSCVSPLSSIRATGSLAALACL